MMFGRPPPVSRRVFDKHDADKSGTICANEFKALCYELGHYLSDAEITVAVASLDKDGSGHITYDEFAKFWASDNRFDNLKKTEDELEKLQVYLEEFKKHDADLSGVICRNEFVPIHQLLVAKGITHLTIDEAFQSLDSDGNGMISFNEYVDWLSRQDY